MVSLTIADIACFTPVHLDTAPPPICSSHAVSLFASVKRSSLNTSTVPALDATKILSDVTCIPTGVLNLTSSALRSPSSSVFIAISRTPVPALASTVYPRIVPSKLNFWTA